MGYFHKQPPQWPTSLAMLFQFLKEVMGLSMLDKLEVQYHVIKKKRNPDRVSAVERRSNALLYS